MFCLYVMKLNCNFSFSMENLTAMVAVHRNKEVRYKLIILGDGPMLCAPLWVDRWRHGEVVDTLGRLCVEDHLFMFLLLADPFCLSLSVGQ